MKPKVLKSKSNLVEVTRAVYEQRCPVIPFDILQVGKICREAISAGLLRVDHGSNPGWGGYSPTKLGLEKIGI
jgi:hypothetical protein